MAEIIPFKGRELTPELEKHWSDHLEYSLRQVKLARQVLGITMEDTYGVAENE